MPYYKVWVRLTGDYDCIEAENEDEAFVIASDDAMSGGCWESCVEEISDDEDVEWEYIEDGN